MIGQASEETIELRLREAFGHYFADRANATQRNINEPFRIGRWSLAIGLAILITCLWVRLVW